MHPTLIAEIGINHNGDINRALQMMRAAKEAGWDAVKFQKREIDLVYTKEFLDSPRESQWGTTQRAQKEGLEFGYAEYERIAEYADELDLKWGASVWDTQSAHFIETFRPSFHKIPSAKLTNLELVKQVASYGRLLYVSTGMSTWDEIEAAIECVNRTMCPFVVMHSVSEYPTATEHVNLQVLNEFRDREWRLGYSGHENYFDTNISCCAAFLGVEAIERHVTLDRNLPGSDQGFSITFEEAAIFKKHGLSAVREMLGDGDKSIVPEWEMAALKKLRG